MIELLKLAKRVEDYSDIVIGHALWQLKAEIHAIRVAGEVEHEGMHWNPWLVHKVTEGKNEWFYENDIPDYPTDLTSTQKLHDELLPDWTAWELRSAANRKRFSVEISKMVDGEEVYANGRAETPAAAWVAAILRAKAHSSGLDTDDDFQERIDNGNKMLDAFRDVDSSSVSHTSNEGDKS